MLFRSRAIHGPCRLVGTASCRAASRPQGHPWPLQAGWHGILPCGFTPAGPSLAPAVLRLWIVRSRPGVRGGAGELCLQRRPYHHPRACDGKVRRRRSGSPAGDQCGFEPPLVFLQSRRVVPDARSERPATGYGSPEAGHARRGSRVGGSSTSFWTESARDNARRLLPTREPAANSTRKKHRESRGAVPLATAVG